MSITSDAKAYYQYLQAINKQNNDASAAQAQKQMQFQERMSNTAHVREVADLKAAGLNPVLSAGGSGGGGASSPSGAMGDVDMSSASALTNYLGHLIQQQTSISVAQIQAAATQSAAATSAAAMKYSADKQYEIAQLQTSSPNTWAGMVRTILQDIGVLRNGESGNVPNPQGFVSAVNQETGAHLTLPTTYEGQSVLLRTLDSWTSRTASKVADLYAAWDFFWRHTDRDFIQNHSFSWFYHNMWDSFNGRLRMDVPVAHVVYD